MNSPRRRDTVYHSTYLVLSLAVLAAACALEIREDERVVTPVLGLEVPGSCWFRHLTGIGCPGCGLTRCFICLAHGDVARSWHFNPAGIAFFVVVLCQVPYRALQVWRIRHGRPQWRLAAFSSVLAYTLAGALLLQWICRWP